MIFLWRSVAVCAGSVSFTTRMIACSTRLSMVVPCFSALLTNSAYISGLKCMVSASDVLIFMPELSATCVATGAEGICTITFSSNCCLSGGMFF